MTASRLLWRLMLLFSAALAVRLKPSAVASINEVLFHFGYLSFLLGIPSYAVAGENPHPSPGKRRPEKPVLNLSRSSLLDFVFA